MITGINLNNFNHLNKKNIKEVFKSRDDNGVVENVSITPMKLQEADEEHKKYYFTTKIELTTGGNYGYTVRVMPRHEMLLEPANLNLVKWITK